MMNFDMTFGRSTTPVVRNMTFQSVEKVSGQKSCLVAFSSLPCPSRMIDDAVAEVEEGDAASARGHDLRKQTPALIEQAMRAGSIYIYIYMGDDVATFEQRKK